MQSFVCQGCGLQRFARSIKQRQQFCGSRECQRLRKNFWQQRKRASDPDYVENQSRAQRAWMDANPNYWREYRAKNPEYVVANRNSQRTRDGAKVIAKSDASSCSCLESGRYLLVGPLGTSTAAIAVNEVTIHVHRRSSSCKERT